MAKDKAGSEDEAGSGRPPLIIDLPAEEVGRRSAAGAREAEAASEPSAAAAPEPQSPPAEEPVIPSAFATRAQGAEKNASASEPGASRRGASFGALIAAALIGGLAGAGGIALLDFVRPTAEPQPDPVPNAEIAELRAEIADLRQAQGESGLAPLQEQIGALDQAVGELRSQSPAGGDDQALEAVESRLAELERLAEAVAASPAGSAPEAAISELSQRVAALSQAGDTSALEAEIGTLRAEFSQLSGRVADAAGAEQVAALEARLETASRQAELALALGPAVAADTLAAALDAGRPFTAELAALRSFELDAAALDGLAAHAETGLATLAELSALFETQVAAVDMSVPVAADAGTLDRLLQSARGLVEVRPASPVEGADPAAVTARIRAALQAGDLAAVLAEWNALPQDAKSATADFARAAEARLAAEDLVARLRSDALSRLATQGEDAS